MVGQHTQWDLLLIHLIDGYKIELTASVIGMPNLQVSHLFGSVTHLIGNFWAISAQLELKCKRTPYKRHTSIWSDGKPSFAQRTRRSRDEG
jgi:hypothetical protein